MALIKSIFLEILISVHRAAYLIIMKRGVQDERITHEFISCEFFFFSETRFCTGLCILGRYASAGTALIL